MAGYVIAHNGEAITSQLNGHSYFYTQKLIHILSENLFLQWIVIDTEIYNQSMSKE